MHDKLPKGSATAVSNCEQTPPEKFFKFRIGYKSRPPEFLTGTRRHKPNIPKVGPHQACSGFDNITGRTWLTARRRATGRRLFNAHTITRGGEVEASPGLKGDSHVTDFAHYYPATRVRWWRGLLRISEMGDGRRRRDFRASPDRSGARVCVRRSASAPLKFGGGLVEIERPRALTNGLFSGKSLP